MNTDEIQKQLDEVKALMRTLQGELNNIRAEQTTNASMKFEIDLTNQESGIKAEIISDYSHLLPEGYEFCEEEQAEKWVKVEENGYTPYKVGDILLGTPYNQLRDCSRPIRKIQYHIAVHEAVTVEPNPYAVDWSNAPEWADSHAFDADGSGWWYGIGKGTKVWDTEYNPSLFHLPSGLDWKQSKTRRPV